MMSLQKYSFEDMLKRAKQYHILSEEEWASYGGSFFDEEMGLHVGQDALRDDDIGGIVPLDFQLELADYGHGGDPDTIKALFDKLEQDA